MTQQDFYSRYSYNPTTDSLGSGGFGSVYKAYDNVDDRYVALKVSQVDPQHPELRLREEVNKAKDMRHQNVARYEACYTFPTFSGEMDIAVMRYYEAGSLATVMRSATLTLGETFDILEQILDGVAYLHKHNIIHRDLKPQNVLIVHHAGRYIPKITDFGISKQLAEGESSAVSNSVLGGTRAYASPEQLKESTIRKNTDIWSFGVIAYQMLAGELPFNSGAFSPTSEEGRQEQFRQMMSGVLPEKLHSIPEPWQRLIRECLVVDATKRLAHAEDAKTIIDNSSSTELDTISCTRTEEIKEEQAIVLEPDVVLVEAESIDDLGVADPVMDMVSPKPEFNVGEEPEQLLLDRNDKDRSAEQVGKQINEDKSSYKNDYNSAKSSNRHSNRKKVKMFLGIFFLVTIVTGCYVWYTYTNIEEVNVIQKEETTAPYKLGDYYYEDGREGVVFQIWDSGYHGKIVSMDEASGTLQWCTDVQYRKHLVIGASSESDGRVNTDKVLTRDDRDRYPAFMWCYNKGSEWYLPSKLELEAINSNQNAINAVLLAKQCTLLAGTYWSSTECVDKPKYYVWQESIEHGYSIFDNKYNYVNVRAVSAF